MSTATAAAPLVERLLRGGELPMAARRLFAAAAADPRFAPHAQWLVVNTWHADNVAVYERSHFAVDAHDVAQDAACRTMVRPLALAAGPAPTSGSPIDERRDVSAPGS